MTPAPPLLRAVVQGGSSGPAPFDVPGELLNSDPLTEADLLGHVVLVDFWTYSCINWLRTLPYLRAWSEKYKPQGLVTIGVHSPEFPFEHDIDNVRRAAHDQRVDYPVVLDSDFTISGALSTITIGRPRTSSTRTGPRWPPIGTTCILPRPTSVMTAPPISRRPEVPWPTGGTATTSRNICGATAGLSWASGPSRRSRPCSTPANGRIAYRFHAHDLISWTGTGRGDAPVRFNVRIDGHEPAPRTDSTSTSMAPGPTRYLGCISSSASRGRSPSTRSRSSSSIPARRPSSSRSADRLAVIEVTGTGRATRSRRARVPPRPQSGRPCRPRCSRWGRRGKPARPSSAESARSLRGTT